MRIIFFLFSHKFTKIAKKWFSRKTKGLGRLKDHGADVSTAISMMERGLLGQEAGIDCKTAGIFWFDHVKFGESAIDAGGDGFAVDDGRGF